MSRGEMGIALGALVAVLAACGPPRCPSGYDQQGDTCYRIHADAGEEGRAADAGDGIESTLDSGAAPDDGAPPTDAADAEEDAHADEDADSIACPAECPEREVCELVDGAPTCACAPGHEACETRCVDLMSDPSNCGSCGYACETGLGCKQGECEQKIRELVLGGNSTCALFHAVDDRYPVRCWGDTSNKLFRDAATEALTPRGIVGVPAVRRMAIDSNKQCAVLPERDVVRCWGLCGADCGNGDAVVLSEMFFDNTVAAVAEVHSSTVATCATSNVGFMSCWGAAFMIGADTDRAFPASAMVAGHSVVSAASIAGSHGCVLTQDQRPACWGMQDRLAIGSSSDASELKAGVFVKAESGAELRDIVQLHTGQLRNCAVSRQGSLWCWGDNGSGMIGPFASGALGTGDRVEHHGAVQVPLSDVLTAAVGLWHTCAVERGGQLYCWGVAPFTGLGDRLQGGDAEGMLLTEPRAVPGLADVLEVKAGEHHTCARRRSGQVVCWGDNQYGQLGDGTTVTRLAPTAVVNLY